MLKALDLWLPDYLRRRPPCAKVTDLLFCICDHFEPFQRTDKAGALARVAQWRREYPKVTVSTLDADGCTPRHSFFYPIEQYDADVLAEIAALAAETNGEIEIHLHHRDDTAAHLRATLEEAKERLVGHGALCHDEEGDVRYGFVHGNWALGNSHPAGKHCGVEDELQVLRETGCYADFTMPSAPDPTQVRKINSIYYSGLRGRKPHDSGADLRAEGSEPNADPAQRRARDRDRLLIVQGPLGLNWHWRKFGLLPRVENADLTSANPPTATRFQVWRRLAVHVQGRPEWIVVKLHTHGAHPNNSPMLLGPVMAAFHRQLSGELTAGAGIRLHYVTAREVANIVHAAEAGLSGDAGQYRNYRFRLTREGAGRATAANCQTS